MTQIETATRPLDLAKDFLDDENIDYSRGFKWDKPFQIRFSSNDEVEIHQKRLGITPFSKRTEEINEHGINTGLEVLESGIPVKINLEGSQTLEKSA